MTRDETITLIKILQRHYCNKEVEDELELSIWQNVFDGYTYAEVFKAATAFMASDARDYPKMPKPGQIRPYIKHIYRIDNDGRICK